MRATNSGARAGGGIVEVLVAMVILAVGVLGLAAASSLIARRSHLGYLHGRSAALAQAQLEGLLVPSRRESAESGRLSFDAYRLDWTIQNGELSEIAVISSVNGPVSIADTLITAALR